MSPSGGQQDFGLGGELIRVKELFMCRAVSVLGLLVPIMISLFTFIWAPKHRLGMKDRPGRIPLTTGAARKRFSHRVSRGEDTHLQKMKKKIKKSHANSHTLSHSHTITQINDL